MACWSVAQGLEHEGKRDAAGAQCVADRQERALPAPHRRHATEVLRVSVPPSARGCSETNEPSPTSYLFLLLLEQDFALSLYRPPCSFPPSPPLKYFLPT